MPLNFTCVANMNTRNGIKALAYGGPGLGKTALAATLGPGSILVSAESGALSLRQANLERIWGVGNPSINYNMPCLEVHTVQDFNDVYDWLTKSHEGKQFHSVAVDSVSEIAEVILNTQKRIHKDPRQAYGELTERMETLVRAYRDMPGKNVYMAAKMEPMKDEYSGIVKYMAAMPGRRLGPSLPYFFDEVFRVGVAKTPQGQEYRFLQTQPDQQYDAKDRSGALASVEIPHLGQVFAKIQGA